MILTTEHHGTIHAPGHPFWHMANASRNAIRLAQWRDRLQTRSGNTPTSSDAADSAPITVGAAFKGMLACALIAGWLALAITAWWALEQAKTEPETRTFERYDGTSYSRTQRVWELGDE